MTNTPVSRRDMSTKLTLCQVFFRPSHPARLRPKARINMAANEIDVCSHDARYQPNNSSLIVSIRSRDVGEILSFQ